MLVAEDAFTDAIWASTADSQLLQLTHLYGKCGHQSGILTTTLAPALAALDATFRASPAGAGSPLGSCEPPGAICTKVFGLSGVTRLSAGVLALDSPYRLPLATWVTGRRVWAALTTR